MDVVGPLVEAAARPERDLGPPGYLHAYAAFEHVHEHLRIVPVRQRRAACEVFDREHSHLASRRAHEVARHEVGYHGIGRGGWLGRGARPWATGQSSQNDDKSDENGSIAQHDLYPQVQSAAILAQHSGSISGPLSTKNMEPLLPFAIALPARGTRQRLSALHGQLRAAILDGRLQPGIRLPSTRALAERHGVARNTVIAAYDLLLAEGYLRAVRGSGTVVAKALTPLASTPRGARTLPRPRMTSRTADIDTRTEPQSTPSRHSFQIGVPDTALFPFALWQRLSGRALRRFQASAAADVDPQGLASLRHAIARHVSFARGVACSVEDIIVTAGAQQAFDLLARVLAPDAGGSFALEEPGYSFLRAALTARRLPIDNVPVDDEGLIVDRIPRRARVVYATPSHQFPLGAVLSLRRRTELMQWCHATRGIVIEDDYDGEFRFTDRPLDALQTLDRSQSVFYVGTFSKCLLPDLRLGYIVAPPWARAALTRARRLSDGGSSQVVQAALATFIQEGHLARHIRRMQRHYDQRRESLLRKLTDSLTPWLTPLPSLAGLHVTALLKSPTRDTTIVAAARDAGVHLAELSPFYAGRAVKQGLMFGLGRIQADEVRPALDIVEGVLRSEERTRRRPKQ